MEVGIEDCLHIEFEYDKGRYHLKDTVVGKIYFLLVSFRKCEPTLRAECTALLRQPAASVHESVSCRVLAAEPLRQQSILMCSGRR